MSKFADFARHFAPKHLRPSRKNPRIRPRAKTKLFNVRQPTPVDPVEHELLLDWWRNYRLQYAAVKDLFAYELKTKEVELAAAIKKDDEGERNRRHALNTAWNVETRTQAITPLRSLLEQLTIEHNQRLLDFRQTMSDRVERERARIQAILAAEPNIITRDNIDAKLEEIFNSDIVDYNFMVDHAGRIVRGSKPYENPNQEAPSSDTEPKTDPPDPLSVQV
ncbi:hypothetical protein T265_15288 [Opisthorchis viverrini]|uniref:Small ribosomal subunit protein mS26 n=1 Tax=Opisthorchis viverrini TaxID=6198 RepID=A0A074Z0K2_OPIVI|nr:hypothetical protein T265_15288 [Opisthorchis viverrini]KER20571.1 hypothetical protein T265_15288 [Opisthorchis viverrini]